MKKSVAGFFIIMLVVAWMLSGCGHSSSPAGASGGETKEPIKIGFSALPTWYMWYLVEEKGFFEKHGVDVELVYFPVYGDSVSALSTGEVDGNSQTLLDSMAPLSNGISLKAVLVTDNSHGGDGLSPLPAFNPSKICKASGSRRKSVRSLISFYSRF